MSVRISTGYLGFRQAVKKIMGFLGKIVFFLRDSIV